MGFVDTIVFNAASDLMYLCIYLFIMSRTNSLTEGLKLARKQLLGGSVARKISATKKFF